MKRFALAAITTLALTAGFAADTCSLYDLRTESLSNPLGIDAAKPRFSWKMDDARPAALQQAWQLQVASTTATLLSGKPDVWDSGRQQTSDSVGIVYGGPALKPTTTYVWRVRAWDKDGKPTEYSAPAIWETGLMSDSQSAWQGKWIAGTYKEPTVDGVFEGVSWVWYPNETSDKDSPDVKAPKGERYFRYHFEMPDKEIVSAQAWAIVDNTCDVYINGKKSRYLGGWDGLVQKDVKSFFKPGVNVIQISANNNSKGPAGVGWCADLKFKDGTTKRIATDSSWRTSLESGKKWPEKGSGNAKWIAVQELGPVGMKPWKKPDVAVDGGPASMNRKAFESKSAPESARLYITALGTYRAEINGQRVGHAILTPDWTDFRDRVIYQTYDVTPLVKSGENVIGVTLGDGWYASALGWKLQRYCFGAPPTRFIAELHLRYPDGSEKIVSTDSTWKTAQSPIQRSEIYYGEIYDAQKEQAGWSSPGFDASDWKPVRVPDTTSTIEFSAQASPLIHIKQTVEPIAVTEPTPGVFVYDMGQNMVGWARLKVKGKAGDKVRLRFVEILNDDGTVYRDNLRRAEATDTYILKGDGEEVFEPHFTYHGFRYIEVTGYPGGKPPKGAIVGHVFHTDVANAGTLETSSKMVNKVMENTQWGLWGNLMSVPTDCPQRDERLGWTGDAQAIWKTACYRMGMESFSEKWMRDLRDAQGKEGDYPNVAPRVISNAPGAPAWGDAGIIVPYQTWRMYGDTRAILEMWDSMEQWMAYIHEENPNYLWLKRRGNDYGDWVPANSTTDKDLIATAYWAYDARLMKEMAAALGKSDKVKEYDALYENIKKAFQDKFIKPDGKIANGSQTCYVLALDNGLVQPELVDKAVAHLVADIKERDNHLSTGFLGSTYLMPVLTENGENDVAITLLLNKTFPSWGYMVEKGATTIWERWNSDTGDPSMNSFNHYCYGAVNDWLYGYLGGIRPVTAGFQKMLLEPHPDPRVQWVNAKYESPYGAIVSNWKNEGQDSGSLNWTVKIPANTTARISLPTGNADKVSVGGKSLADAGLKSTIKNGRVVVDGAAGSYDFKIAK